ncbi:unnamed protein product [Rhizoctonia solani]|uniref:Alpha/beta hydrolase fold-3 domain-containing protein n=1 Tax=Rhizoctonia solani TaxID=456999 RepID=A0A8H3GMQ3_9AGAM|nr:unnamed protein product [Rhizoctonia solani]
MPLTTAGAAVHITPTVLSTFLKHYQTKVHKLKHGGQEHLTDDILFDQAFHIVKAFVELGTHNTVDDLQAFTNTHVPAPFWTTVIPTRIPLSSCNEAADLLITLLRRTSTPSGSDYTEEEAEAEFKRVVGGERWWQVRGLDGVEAEWLAMNKDWEQISKAERRKEKKKQRHREHAARRNAKHGKHPAEDTLTSEEYTEDIDNLTRVMLYVHGGAYFWGSINTHRYQITRFARKFSGRAFAVNYRKAPQYPWPCPLQDCLAAYLYLIRPPPNALHSAINPKHIVLAGDSAGGALALTLLTVIRDMELPMPSGAVLISPWVDLTHSFDSVMTNGDTDIIPPHGFIHKPSPSWPVPAQPPSGGGRAPPSSEGGQGERETGTMPIPTDTGETSAARLRQMDESSEWVQQRKSQATEPTSGDDNDAPIHSTSQNNTEEQDTPSRDAFGGTTTPPDERRPKPAYPQLVKVPVEPGQPPLELRSQIQVYATNEQLTHPLVSPVLHGSLGGLCPLYIVAGNGEVLRDEIIYMAHRASNPTAFPLREELLARGQQRQVAERWTEGTPVHLQVLDDMCHVPTVFTFTLQAKLVYRQVASFMKHLTTSVSTCHSSVHKAFPSNGGETAVGSTTSLSHSQERDGEQHQKQLSGLTVQGDRETYLEGGKVVASEITESPRISRALPPVGDDPESPTHPQQLLRAERVDIHGAVRPLSPDALHIPKDGVGVVKAAPVQRWLTGQNAWDSKYKRIARGVEKERARWEKKAMEVMKKAGLTESEIDAIWKEKTARGRAQEIEDETPRANSPEPVHPRAHVTLQVIPEVGSDETDSVYEERMQNGRRWGPLDLAGEMPPPSAIAGRLDTPDAVDLLKTSLSQMSRTEFRRESQGKAKQAVDRVLRVGTEPVRPRRQSAAEQQVPANPLHGVRMWGGLMGYFVDKTSNGKQITKDKLSTMSNAVIEDVEEDPTSRNGRLPLSP